MLIDLRWVEKQRYNVGVAGHSDNSMNIHEAHSKRRIIIFLWCTYIENMPFRVSSITSLVTTMRRQ